MKIEKLLEQGAQWRQSRNPLAYCEGTVYLIKRQGNRLIVGYKPFVIAGDNRTDYGRKLFYDCFAELYAIDQNNKEVAGIETRYYETAAEYMNQMRERLMQEQAAHTEQAAQ